MINLISIKEGAILRLLSGATAEVVENVGDGQWVNVRYVSSPEAGLVGTEELCHASDVTAVVEPDAPGA